MADYTPSPPRLSVEITEKHKQILDRIPHGLKKLVFQRFIEDLGEAMDKDMRVLPAIISKTLNTLKTSTTFKSALEQADEERRNN